MTLTSRREILALGFCHDVSRRPIMTELLALLCYSDLSASTSLPARLDPLEIFTREGDRKLPAWIFSN